MKKKLFIGALMMVLTLFLTACGCEHEWHAASCSAPKTCSLCGETEGEPLPHTWQDATCTAAKTCTVCKATEGEALPHTWKDATCTIAKTCSVCAVTEGEPLEHTWLNATCLIPKTCSVCQITEGEPLPHTWQAATCITPKTCSVCQLAEGETAAHKWQEATTEAPKTCSVCQTTSGSKLQTDARFTTKSTKALQGTWVSDITLSEEMLGMAGFGNADGQITMTFGNTGALSSKIRPKDETTFMQRYNTYTVNTTYAVFEAQGLSKAQADQALLDSVGLTVPEYVEEELKKYTIDDIFSAYRSEEVYYVEGNEVFTAISWNAKFESNTFTVSNGTLVVDGLSLEEDGSSLTWKKA